MQKACVNIEDYYSRTTFNRIKAFADTKETPFVIIDNQVIRENYGKFARAFPYADIFYAVKANPDIKIIKMLSEEGSNFDVASVYELDKILKLNISPTRCSYGNTIKKRKDIRYFYQKGVRMFATDAEGDLRNIAAQAPGAKIYVRLLIDEDSHSADYPLSRKFGCQADMAVELLALAKELGLVPYGLSFHVGSQQRNVDAWDAAISKMKTIFDRVKNEHDIALQMLNMGGGFPGRYLLLTDDIAAYAEEITHFLKENFGTTFPKIILEPGRSLCANAGILVSEVVLLARKSHTDSHRWLFTDVGTFSGLIETLGEVIKYPIYTEKTGPLEEIVIAGPTCDSMDILYEKGKYCLPSNLAIGDRLYWFSTGAYTTSYSSIEFNGFPPLTQYVLDEC